jgi:hypothetical protein
MIPSQLYNFVSLKDSAGGALEVILSRSQVGTAANVSVLSPVLRVPLDRVMFLGNLSGAAAAGAAQNALSLRFVVVDNADNQIHNIALDRQAAGAVLERDVQTQLWLPSQFGIRAISTFDAGAVPNFSSLSIAGVLFPRANVQLGSMVSG